MLGPHALRLRPREGHDLRIISSRLDIQPSASVRYFRDAENNSVGIATFRQATQQLAIISDVTVEQYPDAPDDAVSADSSGPIPADDALQALASLGPYREVSGPASTVAAILPVPAGDSSLHSMQLLTELSERIRTRLRYAVRIEAGVQAPARTLAIGTGSCRDLAALFIEAARHLGIAARFVSGYLRTDGSSTDRGATHAWAEAFVPDRGWTGFDPTGVGGVGPDHIAVSVARDPGKVPPVAGTFTGGASATLDVGVWVTRLGDAAGIPPASEGCANHAG